jgi:hypothetical protein
MTEEFRKKEVNEMMNYIQTGREGEETAEEQQIHAALDQHWIASARGDLEAEHDIYRDDVICDYPQSGERIHGRRNLQALRGHHPARPAGFDVLRLNGRGDLWVTEYIITYTEGPIYTVSIMLFREGRVAHETQYFAEPFEAPAWRARWVELMRK